MIDLKYYLIQVIASLVSKKGTGCSNAIYTARGAIINKMISGGHTANLCAIDLSKAFDKVNHYALFIKLMKLRNLYLLKYWFY